MITIVDYQMGNLRSVQKGIERVGGTARISSDPREVAEADKLILPGVGAFGDAMAEINKRQLAGPIREFVESGRPFLGICLGLQLLFETGFEHGEFEGLGILAGDVVKFDAPQFAGEPLKVPHMGWNTVTRRSDPPLDGDIPLLAGIPDETHFYFVHSYFVRPTDRSLRAGDSCTHTAPDTPGDR